MNMISLRIFVFLLLTFQVICSNAQLKIGDQPTASRKVVALDVQGSNGLQGLWMPRVNDTSALGIRALNPPDGLVIYHPPSGKLLIRSNNTWVSYLSQAITSIAAGSQSLAGSAVTFQAGNSAGITNDFNIAASSSANTITVNAPDASTTVRGLVTTGAQTIGGAKTFANGVTVTGASGAASNITLGINATTTAAAVSDKYLSVDTSGKITLNAVTVITNRQLRVKSFTADIDGLPTNLNNNSVARYTFTINGANLSTSSSVIVTPLSPLRVGTRIDFSRVYDANTVEMNVSTLSTSQPFTSGNTGTFNITVLEF
jgi:hypothetical protein